LKEQFSQTLLGHILGNLRSEGQETSHKRMKSSEGKPFYYSLISSHKFFSKKIIIINFLFTWVALA
jgi:hypothetical protein